MNFDYHGYFGFDTATYEDSPEIAGHIDFQKMKSYGAKFCIHKATQGNFKDPDFDTNWQNSKGILPRASYHFFDNRYPPKIQAATYWNAIKNDLEGMCFVDLEHRLGANPSYWSWRAWYDFIIEFQRLSGLPNERIGIYTNYFYFTETMIHATELQRDWFGLFTLWLASYRPDPFHPTYSLIDIPAPWTECILLQSGTPAIGIEAGVESKEIDYNQFNGGDVEFAKIFGAVPTIPPEETGGSVKTGFVNYANGINIRNGAGVTFADIGDLYLNDVVVSDMQQAVGSVTWWHLTDAKHNGAEVATSDGRKVSERTDCWCSGQYVTETTVPTPTPSALPDTLYISTRADHTDEVVYRKAA